MDEKHHLAKVRSRVRIPSSLSVRSNGPGEGWVQSEVVLQPPARRSRLTSLPSSKAAERICWNSRRLSIVLCENRVGAIKRAWLVVEDCGGCDAVYSSTPSTRTRTSSSRRLRAPAWRLVALPTSVRSARTCCVVDVVAVTASWTTEATGSACRRSATCTGRRTFDVYDGGDGHRVLLGLAWGSDRSHLQRAEESRGEPQRTERSGAVRGSVSRSLPTPRAFRPPRGSTESPHDPISGSTKLAVQWTIRLSSNDCRGWRSHPPGSMWVPPMPCSSQASGVDSGRTQYRYSGAGPTLASDYKFAA